jgi:nitroreductase
MEVKKAIFERRSIRKFVEKDVPSEMLNELLKAGIWAPSAGNIQPWAFFCITDKERIHKIKTVSPGLLGNPGALICICSDQKKAFERAAKGGYTLALFDCAMAAQNIMLMAFDLGLGSCAVRSFNQAAVRELLEAPEHLEPELIISVGFPAEFPNPPVRRMEVIYWEQYEKRRHENGQ